MARLAVRWSGLLLIAGMVLLAAALAVASSTPQMRQQLPPLANVLLFLAAILLLLSLPAMYAVQADTAGWLGLIGHGLLQTGILLFIVVSAPPLLYSSFDRPFEDSLLGLLLGIALTLGLLLTAITSLRAAVFPRWAGISLLAGTAGFLFNFFIAEWLPRLASQIGGGVMGILLGGALAWIGFSMWKGPSRPPARVPLTNGAHTPPKAGKAAQNR